MTELTASQIESISESLARKLVDEKRALWVDPETHAAHHEWIKARLADEADIREMRKRVIESAIVWALPLFLSLIGLAVWQYVKSAITNTQ